MKKTYVDFEVHDLNLNKFLSRLQDLNISVIKAKKPSSKLLKCRVSILDYEKILADEKLNSFNILLKRKVGIKELLLRSINVVGAVVGALLSFIMFFLSVQRVTSINIIKEANHVCGNRQECIFTEENKLELETYLEAIGVSVGVNKNDINPREIERKLMAKFNSISACTIEKIGTIINIKVFEAELENSSVSTSGLDIIAPENMKISKMIVSRGKARVKAGDIAKKGQVLVSGVDGKKAMATIEGTVYYRSSMSFSESKNQLVRTGNKKTYSYISLLGAEIFKTEENHGFIYAETETNTKYSSYNLFLPLKVISTTYYELENRIVKIPFEDEKDELFSKLRAEAVSKVKGQLPDEYQARFIVTNLENGLYLLDCYVEIFTIINIYE